MNEIARISLALRGCQLCAGTGRVVFGPRRLGRTCECVFRRVFRDCNARYFELRMKGEWKPTVHMTVRGLSVGIRPVEWMVDFELTAARVLRDRRVEWAVFWHHHLHRVPWPDCGKVTGVLDRGEFFHAVYRVETMVGRACMEARPYSVWPRAYFAA